MDILVPGGVPGPSMAGGSGEGLRDPMADPEISQYVDITEALQRLLQVPSPDQVSLLRQTFFEMPTLHLYRSLLCPYRPYRSALAPLLLRLEPPFKISGSHGLPQNHKFSLFTPETENIVSVFSISVLRLEIAPVLVVVLVFRGITLWEL